MNIRLKILFFIPQLVGGGAERVTMNIMKLLDENYFDIHLVVTTLEGSRYKNIPKHITVHDLNISKTILSIYQLRKIIMLLKPDILYSSLFRGHIAIRLALIGIQSKPFTILRSPNSPELLIKYNQVSKLQKVLLESAYKKANIIIAQTPEMKNEIAKYHQINKSKIKVLLNPIDIETINDKLQDISNPFDKNFINVVAAGRITYQKGFDVLLNSFKKVLEQNNKYKLYIIGEEDIIGKTGVEEEIDKLKRMLSELGIVDSVQFLGYQDNPYRYFYFSDLYVLSSRWEGLPNTVLENLYLHKPVVATKCIPFMKELIKEGHNGLLVDVEDVDALSDAILEYKNIEMKFDNTFDSKLRINDFFKEIKGS